MKLIHRAKLFATAAHAAIGQKRKYTGDDYIVHPRAVAELLTDAGMSDDIIAAGWLHDVVEDTKIDIQLIGYFFGGNVASIVDELTDKFTPGQHNGNRETRKTLEAYRLSKCSYAAQTVKYADITDNTKSIILYDPKFAKVYLEEKRFLLGIMDGGHSGLYRYAVSINP